MASRRTTVTPAGVKTSALEPTLDFMRLLWGIEHALQRQSKEMEATIGVTGPQRLVLRVVDQFPGLSAGALADIVRLHPSTITGVVQRLVDKRLLVREGDRADRRRVQLRVRPGAKRLTRQSPATIESAIARALAKVPMSHVAHTRSVLSAIARELEDDGH